LEHEYSLIAPVQELLRRQEYKRADFFREKNRVRNAAKHMDKAMEPDVVADLEDEALWMIVRAYENYRRLGLDPTPRMKEFDDWFWKNVVGAEDNV
jgi:hypothetical protein